VKRAVLCAALLAACLASHAREDKDKDKDKSPSSDPAFVMKASASDLAVINLSRIAEKSASDSGVKKFAQQMIEDHTKTRKDLLDLVNKKRWTAAKTMDADHEKMSTKLLGLKGDEFDRAYVAGLVKEHEAAVALFEKQAKDGQDEDLKAWAKKTLPHLREHLKMARDLNEKLGKAKKDKEK
jgi:putative membrane protein